jgi:hypothetical protein
MAGTRPAQRALILRNNTGEISMHDAAGHQVETAVEARAGFLDRPVVVVLCVSMALAVMALGAIWLGFWHA